MSSLSRFALLAAIALAGCDWRDWTPPERTIRELLNGWDMWDTAAVMPYKTPMPGVVAGTVPTDARDPFSTSQASLDRLSSRDRQAGGALAYRRYCHHCHGPNGDGRIIVGESFTPALPDLRAPNAQTMDDRTAFNQLMRGSRNMIPLDDTLTPLEARLAIAHMRTLAAAPSQPFFPPASARPLGTPPARGR